MAGSVHLLLSSAALNRRAMGMVSLISAFIGAQVGEMQLAVASRLAGMDDANNASSIANLVDAADQSANSLANVAENIGTNLDITV